MPQLASGRNYDTALIPWQRSLKDAHMPQLASGQQDDTALKQWRRSLKQQTIPAGKPSQMMHMQSVAVLIFGSDAFHCHALRISLWGMLSNLCVFLAICGVYGSD